MNDEVSETEETKTVDSEKFIPTLVQGTTPFKSMTPSKTPSKRIKKTTLKRR